MRTEQLAAADQKQVELEQRRAAEEEGQLTLQQEAELHAKEVERAELEATLQRKHLAELAANVRACEPFHCLSLTFHRLVTAFPRPSTSSSLPFLAAPTSLWHAACLGVGWFGWFGGRWELL